MYLEEGVAELYDEVVSQVHLPHHIRHQPFGSVQNGILEKTVVQESEAMLEAPCVTDFDIGAIVLEMSGHQLCNSETHKYRSFSIPPLILLFRI